MNIWKRLGTNSFMEKNESIYISHNLLDNIMGYSPAEPQRYEIMAVCTVEKDPADRDWETNYEKYKYFHFFP